MLPAGQVIDFVKSSGHSLQHLTVKKPLRAGAAPQGVVCQVTSARLTVDARTIFHFGAPMSLATSISQTHPVKLNLPEGTPKR